MYSAGNTGTAIQMVTVTDTTAPVISVISPADGFSTNESIQVISGNINEVATLTINGTPVSLAGDNSFSFAISLAQGSNTVELVAVDPSGNTATQELTLILDITAPVITVNSHQDGFVTNQSGQTLAGNLSESASLTINGTAVTVLGDGSFSEAVTLTEGDNLFVLESIDLAGNTTTQSLTLKLDTTAPSITIVSPVDNSTVNWPKQIITGSLNENASLTINGETVELNSDNSFEHTVLLVEGLNTLDFVATDALGNESTATLTLVLDTGNTLIISVLSPDDSSYTNQSAQVINGRINLVASLTINGEAVTVGTDNTFSHAINLTEGNNVISMQAIDANSNIAEKTINITLDTSAPVITVTSPLNGSVTNEVSQIIKGYLNEEGTLTINGEAVSVTSLESRTLNMGTVSTGQNNVLNQTMSISFDRNNGTFEISGEVTIRSANSFSHDVDLNLGENSFDLIATDKAGNTTNLTISTTLNPVQ